MRKLSPERSQVGSQSTTNVHQEGRSCVSALIVVQPFLDWEIRKPVFAFLSPLRCHQRVEGFEMRWVLLQPVEMVKVCPERVLKWSCRRMTWVSKTAFDQVLWKLDKHAPMDVMTDRVNVSVRGPNFRAEK